MRRKITGAPQKLMREPRAAMSHLEAASLSEEDKERIKALFKEAEGKTDERRGYYKRKAEVFLQNLKKEQESAEQSQTGGAEDEEGYVLKEGEDVGYIQEGDLRRMSKQEREKMKEQEREGYERAKRELDDVEGRLSSGLT